MSIDRYDRAILRALVQDGKVTQQKLGEVAHLSGTAAARRQKMLEDKGVITGYQARIDTAALGFTTSVFVLIQLSGQSRQILDEFEKAIADCPSVMSCHLLSGSEDYLVTLKARDLVDFENIHRNQLSNLPHVGRMQSLFSIREVISRAVPESIFR
jgi:Lrp/AsnC family leucine-responsive transcriptional regulator